ncbi:uncharacterized protein MELLADRAFT_108647 [Melampsora larici-populina 98AG31]|uniref:Uncharacterized protein n=1 Tax=Melampsora larici-populina (strain 98AG31 / pathotype 3-4-7) TaxID=747676 RepID=F4RTT0_MELLP|nr:uncharacterized protein MELLADRAFT_108647 [Melampsora larici-populina 98AG31]EGG04056.1 hypothetical protein MELLADRAFT_108647 [Melampsora larici-populina 98AG31]
MVVPTLIHKRYVKTNPDIVALPAPTPRGPVGLLWPVCSIELVYWTAKHNTWVIACPTNYNNHNWKTWRCNQLNHKLAMMNMGVSPPIIFAAGQLGSKGIPDWPNPRQCTSNQSFRVVPSVQKTKSTFTPFPTKKTSTSMSTCKRGHNSSKP